MTTADMLRAEGEAKGRAEGEAKGRAKGRAEHAAGVLVRLLTRKFGAVTDEARDRIGAASMEQLDHWSERVLDAETLDEVFS